MQNNNDDKNYMFFLFFMFVAFLVAVFGSIMVNLKINILFLLTSIIFLVIICFIIFFYIYLKLEIRRIEYLAKNEKLKEISQYYRDKLDNYSPGILMYCYMNKINFKDYLVSTLLNLEDKGYIKINDNKIEVLNKEDNMLSSDEKYIISCISSKKNGLRKIASDKKEQKHIKELIFEDIKGKELYVKSIIYNLFIIILVGSLLSIMLIFIFNIFNTGNGNSFNIFSWIIVIVTVVLFIIYGNFKFSIDSYIEFKFFTRSPSCIELCVKMQSLKNFLNEFTDLGNKRIEEIKIWDEYIIYSIILNIKGSLNKEVDELYDKYINNN